MKKCRECGEEKPATNEYFGKITANKDGLNNCCKACRVGIAKLYYDNNKEKIKVYHEGNREVSKLYYQNNKVKIHLNYMENRLTVLAKSKLGADREALRYYAEKYREGNKDKIAIR